MVIDSGVDANVGEIYGDSITEVLSITEQTFNGQPTLVYTIRTSANFDKSGVTLDAYTGTAEIEFTQTEVLRVSDLASLSSDLDLFIEFTPSGISFKSKLLAILQYPIHTHLQAKNMIFHLELVKDGLTLLHQLPNGLDKVITSPHFLHQLPTPIVQLTKSLQLVNR